MRLENLKEITKVKSTLEDLNLNKYQKNRDKIARKVALGSKSKFINCSHARIRRELRSGEIATTSKKNGRNSTITKGYLRDVK